MPSLYCFIITMQITMSANLREAIEVEMDLYIFIQVVRNFFYNYAHISKILACPAATRGYYLVNNDNQVQFSNRKLDLRKVNFLVFRTKHIRSKWKKVTSV